MPKSTFAVAVLSLVAFSSCGKVVRAVATSAAGEAVYEGGKTLLEQSSWRPGTIHPSYPNLMASQTFGYWQPKSGSFWTDTRTTEPRRL